MVQKSFPSLDSSPHMATAACECSPALKLFLPACFLTIMDFLFQFLPASHPHVLLPPPVPQSCTSVLKPRLDSSIPTRKDQHLSFPLFLMMRQLGSFPKQLPGQGSVTGLDTAQTCHGSQLYSKTGFKMYF